MKLTDDFIFGAATAAYQAEGATNIDGKGKTAWDDYLNFDPSIASDFYHRYMHDLKLANEFGINGLRISIAWSRIFPTGYGQINQQGVDFYHKLIDKCLEYNVEPFITLHHFDTPNELHKNGDWLNRDNISYFVDFADFCFNEYGNKVKYWITINEPWSVVAGQYIIGHFPPNIKYDLTKAIQAMHNMMLAHAKVVNLYKSKALTGEIGIVHILESKYPINDTKASKEAAYIENIIANRFMLDATFKGEYSKESLNTIATVLTKNHGKLEIAANDKNIMQQAAKQIDFLGVNYYASHFLDGYAGESLISHNGTGDKGTSIFALKGIGQRVHNAAIPTTDWDWPIYPKGLTDMLLQIKANYANYNKIYITENGLGAKDILLADHSVQDDERIDYVKQHLLAIEEAIQQDVNVKGYFMWSLMDVLSWTNGYNKRYGLFYVDFETQHRYPKKSAYWYKQLATRKKLTSNK